MTGKKRKPPQFVVDPEFCKSCGICIKLCPHAVLSADAEGRPVAADPEACTLCRFCEQHCPDFALQVVSADTASDESGDVSAVPEDDEGDG